MDKRAIHEVGKRLGLLPWQAEKDYLQHLYLRELYSIVGKGLVFKGGTCLQKVYGLHRFSRDLDFNAAERFDKKHPVKAAYRLFSYGLAGKVKEKTTDFSVNFLIVFNSEEMKNSLTIQISLREKTLLPPHFTVIIPLYDDIPPYSVFSMDEREIAAEKIRAIMTRGFARDLYDLWYISKKGIQIDKNLVERKLFEVGMKFSMKEFKKKVSECKREWEKELSIIVPAFPKFTSMQKEIFGFLPQDLKHHP